MRRMPRRYRGRKRSLLSGVVVVLISLALIAVIAHFDPARGELSGRAFASDGDSLRIGDERLRLLDIDAPELDQTCRREGLDWACGRAARDRLAQLADGNLQCSTFGRDQYQRLLAVCRADDVDINAQMVREGLAVSSNGYGREEREAREAGQGIWAGEFVHPRAWRDGARQPVNGEPWQIIRDWLGL
jgi:endonuclease YncB( thermonuclease family)